MAPDFDANAQKEETKNDGIQKENSVKNEGADDINLELNDLLDFPSNSSGGDD